MESINFNELVRPFVLSALFAYGLTEALKPIVWKYPGDVFSPSIVRLLALVTGAACGALIDLDPEIILAGAGGGALSAIVVAAVKRLIEKRGQ